MIGQNASKGAVAGHRRPHKAPSEIENKIFALLKSIPIRKPGITDEHYRSWAEGLNGIVVMAQGNHTGPQSERVGAKKTQAELKRLSNLAGKFARTMSSAHQETNALLAAALPAGSSLSQYKRVMNEVIQILYKANDAAGKLTAKGEKRSDEFVIEVTRAAAKAFTALTGRKPTVIVKHIPTDYSVKAQASGPFLTFLKAIFEALGIDASAEYHAQQLIRRGRT
jgi:hypothetical protein